MKKWYKKIDLFSIILIILLIIVSYCFAQLKLFNKDHINFCGYTVFRVITGSMAPEIMPQDIVVVKITKNVNVDDIITYKFENSFITHRIIEKENDSLITKGDANNAEDNPINIDDVLGKVVFVFNNVGIWIRVFTTPQIIIAIIASIIIIRILIFNKSKEKKVQ